MRRIVFTLTAVAIILNCGLAYAQEATDEENMEYEKLKVLEPLVGTYHYERVNEQTGVKNESMITASWSASKKMLKVETKGRRADAGEDLSKQIWWLEPYLGFYVWNNSAKRIELVNVSPWGGRVTISEVHLRGNGVFAFTVLSDTQSPAAKGDNSVIATKDDLTLKRTNRVDAKGNSMDDWEWVYRKVK